MKTAKILGIMLIFLFGFLSANLINFYFVYGELENPFSNIPFSVNNLENTPSDLIHEDQIEVYPNKIIIHIENASISRYAATGSMKPVLDEYSNGIRVIPKSEEEIHVGDIITFEENNYLVVHRVIEKGIDEKGTYFITKGDNNTTPDEKIRFKNVRYITVGIIW